MPATRQIAVAPPLPGSSFIPAAEDHIETLWKRVANLLNLSSGLSTPSAYVAFASPPVEALTDGLLSIFQPHANSASGATLSIDGYVASLRNSDQSAVGVDDLRGGSFYLSVYFGASHYVLAEIEASEAHAIAGTGRQGFMTARRVKTHVDARRNVASGIVAIDADSAHLWPDGAKLETAPALAELFGIFDPSLRSPLGIEPDGSVTLGGALNLSFLSAEPGVTASLRDARGKVVLEAYRDGTFYNGLTEAGFRGAALTDPDDIGAIRLADISGVLIYGQSNSLPDPPALSPAQPYSNVQPADGAFAPLQPTTEESPMYGALNGLVELIATEESIPAGSQTTRWFAATGLGDGGQRIDQLDSRSPFYFRRLLDAVSGHRDLANAINESFNVLGIVMIEGESDSDAETPPELFAARMIRFRRHFAHYVKRHTGQDFEPRMYMTQPASNRARSGFTDLPYIALSMLDIADQDPASRVVMPLYILDHYDDAHFDGYGHYRIGQYLKRVFKTEFIDGEVYRSLKPLSYTWGKRIVDVHYDVDPSRTLAFDTSQVAAAENNGFHLRAPDLTTMIAIVATTIVGNRVRIRTSADIPQGALLTYACGKSSDPSGDPTAVGPTLGPRGNLRDNSGATETYVEPVSAATVRLDKWALVSAAVKP